MNISQYYEIVSENKIGSLTTKVAQVRLPVTSQKKRSILLYSIMDDVGAMAMVEFWKKTSILYKPKQDFLVILIFGEDDE